MLRLLRLPAVAGLLILTMTCLDGTAHASTAHMRGRFVAGREMLSIINADRRAAGLPALSFDTSLATVAKSHSREMAEKHYFSHTSPEGLSPFDRLRWAGILYQSAGENLGMDNGTDRTAILEAIEVAMLHSPEHRANLLRPTFTHVGIGIISHGGTVYVTEDFIS